MKLTPRDLVHCLMADAAFFLAVYTIYRATGNNQRFHEAWEELAAESRELKRRGEAEE